MLKQYYQLAKPGIVYGNLFTTLAAFLYASRWHFGPVLFLATVVGLGLVIGSACVFNNYLDRDIDKKMARTKDRALASRAIPVPHALLYAVALGGCGIILLYACVNTLTAGIAFLGFIFYVCIYGYAKRVSHWGAVVGSISGAVPIVVGYTAVTNRLDVTALILFLILVMWQMPHFYGIALYRLNDYTAAGIPVLPAKKGVRTTKVHIVAYMVAYLLAVSAFTIFAHGGYVYVASSLLFGFAWLWLGVRGFTATDTTAWAKKLFLFSLVVLVAFSITLAVAPFLP